MPYRENVFLKQRVNYVALFSNFVVNLIVKRVVDSKETALVKNISVGI